MKNQNDSAIRLKGRPQRPSVMVWITANMSPPWATPMKYTMQTSSTPNVRCDSVESP